MAGSLQNPNIEADAAPEELSAENMTYVILVEQIATTTNHTYTRGSLFTALNIDQIEVLTNLQAIQVQSLDKPDQPLVGIPGKYLEKLDGNVKDILQCVKRTLNRWSVYADKTWLQEVVMLKLGEPVLLHNVTGLDEETPGWVRFKGPVAGVSGIYFGVELDEEYAGKGTSNGMFRKMRYFQCDDDCAVFVSAYCVRYNRQYKQYSLDTLNSSQSSDFGIKEPDPNMDLLKNLDNFNFALTENVTEKEKNVPSIYRKSKDVLYQPKAPSSHDLSGSTDGGSTSGQRAIQPRSVGSSLGTMDVIPQPSDRRPTEQSESYSSDPETLTPTPSMGLVGPGDHNLRVGDRIVWMSDDGPQSGTVRWIGGPGELDPAEIKPTAGVEFDEPVGTGTGRYKGRQVFTARKGHAGLMPIIGLIKEEDFYGSKPRPTKTPVSSVNNSEMDDDLARAIAASLMDSGATSTSTGDYDIRIPPEGVTDFTGGVVRPKEPVSGLKSNQPQPHSGHQSITTSMNYTLDSAYPSHKSEHPSVISRQESSGYRSLSSQKPRSSMMSSSSEGQSSPGNSYESSVSIKRPQPNEPMLQIDDRPVKKDQIDVDSLVEVLKNPVRYGQIKWRGFLDNAPDKTKEIAGILMEDEDRVCYTDGVFRGRKVFDAPPHRAFFIYLHQCRPDRRAKRPVQSNLPQLTNLLARSNSTEQESIRATHREEPVPDIRNNDQLVKFVGKPRGIQGFDRNSGLVSLLYIFLQFSDSLDVWLNRDRHSTDVECFEVVRYTLKFQIASPLRLNGYVDSKPVEYLHKILAEFSESNKLTAVSRCFPEDFVNLLFGRILKMPPYISMSNGTTSNFLQILSGGEMNSLQQLQFPSVQELLEVDMYEKDTTLAFVPELMMVQTQLERVFPSLELDLGIVMKGVKQACFICGEIATLVCHQCFDVAKDFTAATYYCTGCSETKHKNRKHQHHQPIGLEYADDATSDTKLRLFAVLSHVETKFVCFAKCYKGLVAPWVKFDCMVDRISSDGGNVIHFVPEVKEIAELSDWLTPVSRVKVSAMKRYDMPANLQYLTLGTYMCFYRKEP